MTLAVDVQRGMCGGSSCRLIPRATLLLALVCGSWLAALPAHAADDMPAPQKAPRIKVQQQKLVEEARGNRIISGLGRAIEAERIKVGDTEVRLFGIVVPATNAPHGAGARAALEKLLLNETLTCRVQERDKAWRLLASCKTDKHNDLSQMMLQDGWAVVARGTVQGTNFADLYLAAESKAQLQRLGMWTEPKLAEATPSDSKTSEAPGATDKATLEKPAADNANEPDKSKSSPTGSPPVLAAVTTALPQLQVPTMLPPEVMTTASAAPESAPVWVWFAGFAPMGVMILYSLGQIALRRYEYMQERKALAAALRGELMAARAICISRADTLGYGSEAVNKLSTVWPRLRSTLYQAYVGRLGLLGPELSRRVSSLYGQFSDYAQFYATRPNAEAAGKIDNATVQQTLFTIIDHIEDTLNNLQQVEASGKAPRRLLPQRHNINRPAASQRLAEKAQNESINYADANLVEDALALKSLMAPQPKPDPTLDDKPTTRQEKSPLPTESPPESDATIIAAILKQGNDTKMTADTLATITAEHDALKAEEEPMTGTFVPATDIETEVGEQPVPAGAPQAERAAEKAAVAPAPRKTAKGRKPRPDGKPDDKTGVAGEAHDDYYDFRSQAVRIAKQ